MWIRNGRTLGTKWYDLGTKWYGLGLGYENGMGRERMDTKSTARRRRKSHMMHIIAQTKFILQSIEDN